MVSVAEAKEIIRQQVKSLQPIKQPLKAAAGLTLAEDVYATTDIPGFVQSSVDGYAIRFDERVKALRISGEMAAGATTDYTLDEVAAARIFTGAPLPAGADTVVMQEYCTATNGSLTINDAALKRGDNVRPKGAEIMQGALAMQQGEALTAAAIGFLAGIGVAEVSIYPAPRTTLIVTGKEIRPAGTALAFGQVYDANSVMLSAVLAASGVRDVAIVFVDDHLEEVETQLAAALAKSDLVLLTGGISVGDYDFVLQATKNCGVQQHFHKVKQKPGKPLYFGTTAKALVFGLPGNPASSLTCYYEYVLAAIDAMLQRPASLVQTTAILQNDYSKKAGLTHFLKGSFADGKAALLKAQESFRLVSYARASCLIVFDEARESFTAGESIGVHLLPF